MASINGYKSYIAGATGSQGVLGPEASWKIYVLPRGAHASQASTGAIITFDSADAAARFPANYWVQIGTNTANIRQVSAVAGNSINVGTAVTVAQNDRVFLIGSTQPTVTGGSASYQPHTTIWARDDDQGSPISNSMLTSDNNGGFEFFARNNFYDALIQDSNRSAQMSLVDIVVGVTATVQLPVPFVYNVKDPEFGAIGGNNSAVDDTAAIQAALDAAGADVNGSQAGVCYLPRDTYHISSQLHVPRSARMVGDGARNSVIKCGDAWAGNSYMVFLGDNNANSHQTRLEHLYLDCNSKTMTSGVEGNRIQEASGVFNCLIGNATAVGISFGGACQNFSIMGVEVGGLSSGFLGIDSSGAGVIKISDVTVSNFDFGTNSTKPGILLRAGNQILDRIHGEAFYAVVGITTSASGGGGTITVANCNPHVSTASSYTVHVNDNGQGAVNLINIVRSAATAPIFDEAAGLSMANAHCAQYVRNFVGSDDILFCPDTGGGNNYINPSSFRIGCSTTFDRTVGFTAGYAATILTGSAAGTINMGSRNTFILSTGASVHTLTGVSGQFAHFIGAAGAAVDFVRGSTLALTAALVGISQNMSISFRCLPNGASWVQMHPVASNGAFA